MSTSGCSTSARRLVLVRVHLVVCITTLSGALQVSSGTAEKVDLPRHLATEAAGRKARRIAASIPTFNDDFGDEKVLMIIQLEIVHHGYFKRR